MLRLKKTWILLSFIAVFSLYSFYSCKKTDAGVGNPNPDPLAALNLPAAVFNYANQPLPGYLLAPTTIAQDNTPITNPVSDWGATLGRVLFYDKTLSINNSVSCASCHKQNLAFADDRALSIGFAGGSTGRNSMSLVNTKYYRNKKFFWDERASTLEIQTLMPIQDHVEMGMNLDTLINRLRSKAHYPVLFQNAFGNRTITSDKIAAALAQFVRSIISYQSKFDAGRVLAPIAPPQAPFPNFTLQENQGKALFFNPITQCNVCHGLSETFTAPEAKNNGIENPSVDRGVGGISNINAQIGNFKTSSLKSIELTAPYMHDGRFLTLEQVVEHYNSGILQHPNLSPELSTPIGTPKRLNLTPDQKASLVAFLKTLTDNAITADPKFSNPFK